LPKQLVSVRKIATDYNTYQLTYTDIDEKKDASLVLNDVSYTVPGAVAKLFVNMCDEIDVYYNLFKEMKNVVGDYGES